MYLMQLEKGGVDINERIKKRVIRIQHLMSTIIIRGQKKGEIKNVPVKDMNDLFYVLLESAIFRLGILNQTSLDPMRSIIDFTVEQFSIRHVFRTSNSIDIDLHPSSFRSFCLHADPRKGIQIQQRRGINSARPVFRDSNFGNPVCNRVLPCCFRAFPFFRSSQKPSDQWRCRRNNKDVPAFFHFQETQPFSIFFLRTAERSCPGMF